jgi:tRNA 2-thiouridine synthesizing protein E
MVLVVENVSVAVNEEGFLRCLQDWNEQVAIAIATVDEIELTPEHWEIILFIRQYYQNFKHLPNARVFTKAVAKQLGEEKGNSRYLHKLFPEGPLKYACKIAGLPKPPTCL